MNILLISKSFLVYNTLYNLLEKSIGGSKITIIKEKYQLDNIDYNNMKLIIIDLRSNIINGEDICQMIKSKNNEKIVAIDLKGNINSFIYFVSNEIDGYITDVDSDDEFIFRIKRILKGKKYYDYEMSKHSITMNDVNSIFLLTTREKEVLDLICKGLSNESIGNHLYISKHTVKRYVSSIYNKLNINNRKELMVYIRQYN